MDCERSLAVAARLKEEYEPGRQTVQLTLPRWAADLIRATIEMDSKSAAFDLGLRQQLAEALGAIEEADQPQPGR